MFRVPWQDINPPDIPLPDTDPDSIADQTATFAQWLSQYGIIVGALVITLFVAALWKRPAIRMLLITLAAVLVTIWFMNQT
jgi:hypothetical protein